MNIDNLNNKKVDIFGTKYTINIVDTLDVEGDDRNYYGLTVYDNKTIKISKNVLGTKLPKTELELTLLHELIHAILCTGLYNSSSDDEPLVEWLARCIYSFKNQNII